MMGGAMVSTGPINNYSEEMTPFVFVTCFVAATGGLMFGYDIGISGGVTAMSEFLEKFFPSVYKKMTDATTESESENQLYCRFNSQLLTTFTSSLYIAALIASFFASAITRVFGRKLSMLIGGTVFLVGAIINGLASNVAMLIVGRLLLGVGVGFTNQSVPLYLSEMAPAKLRGALNMGFQLAITIGILVANLVNYGANRVNHNGWRWSLAVAAAPAVILTAGALLLPDTPNSLLERGHMEKARMILQKIRGTTYVDEEFQDLMDATEQSKEVDHPWKNIIQRRYRPQLILTILIPFFQQFTGINIVMFYSPVLYKTLGFGEAASLMSAVITGLVNVFSTLVSIFTVDKCGRRFLFLEGGIQMIIFQTIIGLVVGSKFGVNDEGALSPSYADLVLVLICFYVAAYAWSWGPLGWLVPSEIFPLEIRSAGQAINVCVNMLFTFLIAQLFLTLLCHLKFGLFFFFAGWEIIMTIFIYFFMPETKNVPIEEISRVWKQHWFWGKYIPDEAITGGIQLPRKNFD